MRQTEKRIKALEQKRQTADSMPDVIAFVGVNPDGTKGEPLIVWRRKNDKT